MGTEEKNIFELPKTAEEKEISKYVVDERGKILDAISSDKNISKSTEKSFFSKMKNSFTAMFNSNSPIKQANKILDEENEQDEMSANKAVADANRILNEDKEDINESEIVVKETRNKVGGTLDKIKSGAETLNKNTFGKIDEWYKKVDDLDAKYDEITKDQNPAARLMTKTGLWGLRVGLGVGKIFEAVKDIAVEHVFKGTKTAILDAKFDDNIMAKLKNENVTVEDVKSVMETFGQDTSMVDQFADNPLQLQAFAKTLHREFYVRHETALKNEVARLDKEEEGGDLFAGGKESKTNKDSSENLSKLDIAKEVGKAFMSFPKKFAKDPGKFAGHFAKYLSGTQQAEAQNKLRKEDFAKTLENDPNFQRQIRLAAETAKQMEKIEDLRNIKSGKKDKIYRALGNIPFLGAALRFNLNSGRWATSASSALLGPAGMAMASVRTVINKTTTNLDRAQLESQDGSPDIKTHLNELGINLNWEQIIQMIKNPDQLMSLVNQQVLAKAMENKSAESYKNAAQLINKLQSIFHNEEAFAASMTQSDLHNAQFILHEGLSSLENQYSNMADKGESLEEKFSNITFRSDNKKLDKLRKRFGAKNKDKAFKNIMATLSRSVKETAKDPETLKAIASSLGFSLIGMAEVGVMDGVLESAESIISDAIGNLSDTDMSAIAEGNIEAAHASILASIVHTAEACAGLGIKEVTSEAVDSIKVDSKDESLSVQTVEKTLSPEEKQKYEFYDSALHHLKGEEGLDKITNVLNIISNTEKDDIVSELKQNPSFKDIDEKVLEEFILDWQKGLDKNAISKIQDTIAKVKAGDFSTLPNVKIKELGHIDAAYNKEEGIVVDDSFNQNETAENISHEIFEHVAAELHDGSIVNMGDIGTMMYMIANDKSISEFVIKEQDMIQIEGKAYVANVTKGSIEDATIKKGEGIIHAFARQLRSHDSNLTEKDARIEASKLAFKFGYMEKGTGKEIRVFNSDDNPAYQLEFDNDGKAVKIHEIKGSDTEIHELDQKYETELEKYEYEVENQKVEARSENVSSHRTSVDEKTTEIKKEDIEKEIIVENKLTGEISVETFDEESDQSAVDKINKYFEENSEIKNKTKGEIIDDIKNQYPNLDISGMNFSTTYDNDTEEPTVHIDGVVKDNTPLPRGINTSDVDSKIKIGQEEEELNPPVIGDKTPQSRELEIPNQNKTDVENTVTDNDESPNENTEKALAITENKDRIIDLIGDFDVIEKSDRNIAIVKDSKGDQWIVGEATVKEAGHIVADDKAVHIIENYANEEDLILTGVTHRLIKENSDGKTKVVKLIKLYSSNKDEKNKENINITASNDIEPHVEDDVEPHVEDDVEPHVEDDVEPHVEDDVEPIAEDDIKKDVPAQIALDFADEFSEDEKNKISKEYNHQLEYINILKSKLPDLKEKYEDKKGYQKVAYDINNSIKYASDIVNDLTDYANGKKDGIIRTNGSGMTAKLRANGLIETILKKHKLITGVESASNAFDDLEKSIIETENEIIKTTNHKSFIELDENENKTLQYEKPDINDSSGQVAEDENVTITDLLNKLPIAKELDGKFLISKDVSKIPGTAVACVGEHNNEPVLYVRPYAELKDDEKEYYSSTLHHELTHVKQVIMKHKNSPNNKWKVEFYDAKLDGSEHIGAELEAYSEEIIYQAGNQGKVNRDALNMFFIYANRAKQLDMYDENNNVGEMVKELEDKINSLTGYTFEKIVDDYKNNIRNDLIIPKINDGGENNSQNIIDEDEAINDNIIELASDIDGSDKVTIDNNQHFITLKKEDQEYVLNLSEFGDIKGTKDNQILTEKGVINYDQEKDQYYFIEKNNLKHELDDLNRNPGIKNILKSNDGPNTKIDQLTANIKNGQSISMPGDFRIGKQNDSLFIVQNKKVVFPDDSLDAESTSLMFKDIETKIRTVEKNSEDTKIVIPHETISAEDNNMQNSNPSIITKDIEQEKPVNTVTDEKVANKVKSTDDATSNTTVKKEIKYTPIEPGKSKEIGQEKISVDFKNIEMKEVSKEPENEAPQIEMAPETISNLTLEAKAAAVKDIIPVLTKDNLFDYIDAFGEEHDLLHDIIESKSKILENLTPEFALKIIEMKGDISLADQQKIYENINISSETLSLENINLLKKIISSSKNVSTDILAGKVLEKAKSNPNILTEEVLSLFEDRFLEDFDSFDKSYVEQYKSLMGEIAKIIPLQSSEDAIKKLGIFIDNSQIIIDRIIADNLNITPALLNKIQELSDSTIELNKNYNKALDKIDINERNYISFLENTYPENKIYLLEVLTNKNLLDNFSPQLSKSLDNDVANQYLAHNIKLTKENAPDWIENIEGKSHKEILFKRLNGNSLSVKAFEAARLGDISGELIQQKISECNPADINSEDQDNILEEYFDSFDAHQDIKMANRLIASIKESEEDNNNLIYKQVTPQILKIINNIPETEYGSKVDKLNDDQISTIINNLNLTRENIIEFLYVSTSLENTGLAKRVVEEHPDWINAEIISKINKESDRILLAEVCTLNKENLEDIYEAFSNENDKVTGEISKNLANNIVLTNPELINNGLLGKHDAEGQSILLEVFKTENINAETIDIILSEENSNKNFETVLNTLKQDTKNISLNLLKSERLNPEKATELCRIMPMNNFKDIEDTILRDYKDLEVVREKNELLKTIEGQKTTIDNQNPQPAADIGKYETIKTPIGSEFTLLTGKDKNIYIYTKDIGSKGTEPILIGNIENLNKEFTKYKDKIDLERGESMIISPSEINIPNIDTGLSVPQLKKELQKSIVENIDGYKINEISNITNIGTENRYQIAELNNGDAILYDPLNNKINEYQSYDKQNKILTLNDGVQIKFDDKTTSLRPLVDSENKEQIIDNYKKSNENYRDAELILTSILGDKQQNIQEKIIKTISNDIKNNEIIINNLEKASLIKVGLEEKNPKKYLADIITKEILVNEFNHINEIDEIMNNLNKRGDKESYATLLEKLETSKQNIVISQCEAGKFENLHLLKNLNQTILNKMLNSGIKEFDLMGLEDYETETLKELKILVDNKKTIHYRFIDQFNKYKEKIDKEEKEKQMKIDNERTRQKEIEKYRSYYKKNIQYLDSYIKNIDNEIPSADQDFKNKIINAINKKIDLYNNKIENPDPIKLIQEKTKNIEDRVKDMIDVEIINEVNNGNYANLNKLNTIDDKLMQFLKSKEDIETININGIKRINYENAKFISEYKKNIRIGITELDIESASALSEFQGQKIILMDLDPTKIDSTKKYLTKLYKTGKLETNKEVENILKSLIEAKKVE